jgi:hypothetical protein
MRLVNPGTGEVSDRLTILALKICAGKDAGRDVAHFEAERAALLTKIRTKTLNGAWFESVLELAAVNAFIWRGEDLLRAIRLADSGAADWQGTARLAMQLQAFNDRRAELVRQINKDAGDGETKEKA